MNPARFNVNETTLYTEADIKAGMSVELDSDGKAVIAGSNSRFIGICTKAEGNYISVALTGIVTVPYTGSAPSIGYELLSGDGNGNVKFNGGSEVDHLVLSVNTEDKLVTFML